MANYKNFNSNITNKQVKLRELNNELENLKRDLPNIKSTKNKIFEKLPLFMQDYIDGKWNHKTNWGGSFLDIYNQNSWSHPQWENYQNYEKQVNSYKNRIAELPEIIKTERENLKSLEQAEIDKLKAETAKIKEEQRLRDELERAKTEAKEFTEENKNILDTNAIQTQEQLQQNIQGIHEELQRVKAIDPMTLYQEGSNPNENPSTKTIDQKDNINSGAKNNEISTLEYHNMSAPILAKHPEFAEQYNRSKFENPKKALENLVQNAYEKDIASGNTDNLIDYRNIIDKVEKENLKSNIAEKKAEAKKEAEKANINPKTGKQYTEEERKKALEEMIGNKQEFPGATANDLKFEGKPIFYSNLLKNIALRTAQLTSPEKTYPYYNEPRIAKPSKEETIAYDLLTQNLLKPEYKETYKDTLDDLQKLKEQSPSKNLSEADEIAAKKTTNENIEDYVNPKTNSVLDLIQKRALRNFNENIMPKVSAPFISRGSFNTGARAEAQARARRDLMEGLMDTETQYLASAYDKARDTASADKKTYLNYKLSKAGLEGEEILRKGKIAEDTSKLMDSYHKNKLLDMEALRTIGQNQRDVKQRELDLQHEEFKNQVDYPLRQVDILNKMIHQLPVDSLTGHTSRTVPTKNEQVSPWQTGAGVLGQMASMNMMNKAEGGIIQRHADGGMIDKMKDQYLQDLMTRAQNTSNRAQNPWAHYMLGLSNSLASSKNPNVMGALGEASTHGVGQFMNAREYNAGLEDQNLGFKKSIIDYLDQAEARKQEKRMHELQMQKIMAELNGGDGIEEKHIPSLTPSNQVPVVTYKNGKVSGMRLVDPSHFAETNNIVSQDMSQPEQMPQEQAYQTSIPTQFDSSKTPGIKELFNINMHPKLPTNAAEKEYYDQDVKNQLELKKEAEKAKADELKILALKRQLPELATGALRHITNAASQAGYALGGEGKAAQAAQAFKEVQKMDLAELSDLFKPFSDTDAKIALDMSSNPANTKDSIKEQADVKLAAVKIKQIKAEAKEIWLSKYGSTRGFDANFNLWAKNTKLFNNVKNKKTGEIIRKKLNENHLDTWPEMFNPNFLEKYVEKQSRTDSKSNFSAINQDQFTQLYNELKQ
jgi:hypothetical protein